MLGGGAAAEYDNIGSAAGHEVSSLAANTPVTSSLGTNDSIIAVKDGGLGGSSRQQHSMGSAPSRP